MKFGRQAGKIAIFHTEAFRKNIFSCQEDPAGRGSSPGKVTQKSSNFPQGNDIFEISPGEIFKASGSAFRPIFMGG